MKKLQKLVYQDGGSLSAAVVCAFCLLFCNFRAKFEWKVDCIMCEKRSFAFTIHLLFISIRFVETLMWDLEYNIILPCPLAPVTSLVRTFYIHGSSSPSSSSSSSSSHYRGNPGDRRIAHSSLGLDLDYIRSSSVHYWDPKLRGSGGARLSLDDGVVYLSTEHGDCLGPTLASFQLRL